MEENTRIYTRPVWKGGEIYRETFAMVMEPDGCRARFLFKPDQIIRVESYDGTRSYQEEKDYRIEGDYFVRTEESTIPYARWEYFYHTTETEAVQSLKEREMREGSLGFGPVKTTDGKYVNLTAVGHPSYVTDYQITVTYRTSETWDDEYPESSVNLFPRFFSRMLAKNPVKIVLYGDSISCGYDCSGMYHQKPEQPVWPELVKNGLKRSYGAEPEMINQSVAGVDSDWAIRNVKERVCQYRPDLVILGFGMNDRCRGKEYLQKTRQLIAEIQNDCRNSEILLIATSLPNPLLHTEPYYFCGYQQEQGEELKKLCVREVGVASVQKVQEKIMEKKRYIDLTGNLLNHPNDYLSRIQAQVVLAALLEKEG